MRLLIVVLASILAIACLPSSVRSGGVNLSWDDCGNNGGSSIRRFACDTNAGQHTLVGSFVSPYDVASVISTTATLDINLNGSSVSDWWLLQSGSCRAGALAANFDFTSGPSSCFDYWQGGAIGGVTIDPPVGNRLQIRVQTALLSNPGPPIPAETEIYSFKLNLSHAKTTGEGACSGCGDGACIQFSTLRIFEPMASNVIGNPSGSCLRGLAVPVRDHDSRPVLLLRLPHARSRADLGPDQAALSIARLGGCA